MGESPIHKCAEKIAGLLARDHIDYALVGALSLGVYGFERATEDVDILIRREDLERFKEKWIGRGYVNLREGGKAIRDTVNDVRIDFLITGDFPGDGKPKPVAFPDPATARVESGKYSVVDLPHLVELKLASGMTAPHRLHDIADVMRLIRVAGLPRELRRELDPYVREKFDELWELAQVPDEDY